MPRWTETRDAFAGSLQNRRLWLIQFLANPILFLLFVAWLRIPEARIWQLMLIVLLAAGIVVAALVLHGGTLVYFCDRFRSDSAELKAAFGRALRHVAAIAVWVCVFYLVFELAGKLHGYHDQAPTYIRSMLPAFLRRHITLVAVTRLFDGFAFVLQWILTPGLLLPFAVSAADRGFSGFGGSGWTTWKTVVRSLQYWGVLAIAVVLGVLVSGSIIHWTPRSQNPTFTGETISLVLRFAVAYLLALFSWMLACSMIGRRCRIPEHAPGDSGV